MANDNQFKLRTRFIATRGVQEYRATIDALVTREDRVLELGCAWGTTTALLAECAGLVVGTDVSRECIQEARRRYPSVRFEVLDAFDVRAALGLEVAFTKVYADLSGLSSYRALLDVIALLTMYATVFRLEAMVVKSGALKHFAAHCWAWPAGLPASVLPSSVLPSSVLPSSVLPSSVLPSSGHSVEAEDDAADAAEAPGEADAAEAVAAGGVR